jgi:chromosome partitioning protein
MSTVVAISNQKGGVGKTTSAINIAAYMARAGHKVLLIDLDPQKNLSKAWRLEESDGNVYSLILGDTSYGKSIIPLFTDITPGAQGILHMLPGSENFARYEKLRAGEVNAQFDLKKTLYPIKENYDYIILDCPPALGLITVNAFACSNHVLVPMEAQLFAIEGLESICNTIKKVQEFINPGLSLLGAFFVRHNKRRILNKEVENFIEDQYNGVLINATIRENVDLKEAPHAGKDIFSYAPNSNGAKDYESLTQVIMGKICIKEKK